MPLTRNPTPLRTGSTTRAGFIQAEGMIMLVLLAVGAALLLPAFVQTAAQHQGALFAEIARTLWADRPIQMGAGLLLSVVGLGWWIVHVLGHLRAALREDDGA